jgi:hypothetical protein
MKIPKRLLSKIKNYSLYRGMNTSTCTGYSFSLLYNEKGKAINWQGGYIWWENFDGEEFRIDFEDMDKIHINPDIWEGNEDV